jgi:hypothetical protein
VEVEVAQETIFCLVLLVGLVVGKQTQPLALEPEELETKVGIHHLKGTMVDLGLVAGPMTMLVAAGAHLLPVVMALELYLEMAALVRLQVLLVLV